MRRVWGVFDHEKGSGSCDWVQSDNGHYGWVLWLRCSVFREWIADK